MAKTKAKLLKGLIPGTPEYVLKHAEWRRSRGKKNASEVLRNVEVVSLDNKPINIKNPYVSLFVSQHCLKEVESSENFMEGLGFPTEDDIDIYDKLLAKYRGKVVTIKNGDLQVVGEFHSLTMIFGNYINLTKVQEEECSSGVLESLNYYHPRDYNAELEQRNFGFVSAAFQEDPKTTDLLVVPTDGVVLECEGPSIQL